MVEKKVSEKERIIYDGFKEKKEEKKDSYKKVKKKVNEEVKVIEEDPEKVRKKLKECYLNIIKILKEYIVLKEEYYNLIALWIIGTYFHDKFYSFPFLYFNAMKGSGKSRTLNLIIELSKDGEMLLSPTEATLFRTNGTLGIDEFEGIGRKGIESIRELLNASYKKGAKVRRMAKKKTFTGEMQVVESFEVYRPIVLANIWGMESVLGDRCISLILEKSNDKRVTNLIEIFREEEEVIRTKKDLIWCSLCRCSFSTEVYQNWNSFIKSATVTYTNNTNNINNTNNTNYTNPFEIIKEMGLNGREMELSLPICLIANEIEIDILKETTLTLKEILLSKKQEELIENLDISLYDFISQKVENNYFISMNQLVQEFREFLQSNEEWINTRWLGRALKRLNLIKEKRRISRGVEVILNYKKAQEKIKIFR